MWKIYTDLNWAVDCVVYTVANAQSKIKCKQHHHIDNIGMNESDLLIDFKDVWVLGGSPASIKVYLEQEVKSNAYLLNWIQRYVRAKLYREIPFENILFMFYFTYKHIRLALI